MAKKVETSILDQTPFFAGRNNLPEYIFNKFKNDLTAVNLNNDTTGAFTTFDVLKKGKVGSQFWVAKGSCDENSLTHTLVQINLIKALAEKYSGETELLKTVADIDYIFNYDYNTVGGFILVDGGQVLQSEIAIVHILYELGARALSLATPCDTTVTDTIQDVTNKKLTEFGDKLIDEMIALGMLIDLAGMNKDIMLYIMQNKGVPVMISHSAASGVFLNEQNVDDEVLEALKKNQGILLLTLDAKSYGATGTNITMANVIQHLNYIADKIGYENIGISGDFDNTEAKPSDITTPAQFPDLFKELKATWSDQNLINLAGVNFKRVFREVEKKRNITNYP